MKERVSIVFLQKGQVDVKDGAFVEIDKEGVRAHIPVGSIACIMLVHRPYYIGVYRWLRSG
jgi:CRISPR-associated protein Cas1